MFLVPTLELIDSSNPMIHNGLIDERARNRTLRLQSLGQGFFDPQDRFPVLIVHARHQRCARSLLLFFGQEANLVSVSAE